MKYLSWIITGIFLAFLFSCSVEKRAAKKVSWLLAHDLMDDNCARLFPVIDSIVVKDSISFDTIYNEPEIIIDTVDCEKKDSIIYRYVKCPPHQVITNTIRKDSIIFKRNIAEEQRLESEIVKKEKIISEKDQMIVSKDKKIDKNNFWKLLCIITWSLIVIYGVLKIKKVV